MTAGLAAPPRRSLPAATGMLRLPFACGRTLLPEFGESRFPVKLPAATGMLRLPFACGRTLLPEFGESRFPVKVWGKSSIQDYKKGI